ncbi:MAG TPA: hypothetical protein VFJ43_03775, partial [Bacteroidia bacterium]|nr:hypothetical protein [Bacteroidia bacterium]
DVHFKLFFQFAGNKKPGRHFRSDRVAFANEKIIYRCGNFGLVDNFSSPTVCVSTIFPVGESCRIA